MQPCAGLSADRMQGLYLGGVPGHGGKSALCDGKPLWAGSVSGDISEFAPQLELLYNNSINMISWCRTLYSYDKRSADMEHKENPYYAMPIPAYKKGYRLFANSHLPEKITVFGVGQRNQDIYNADELNRLLGKTVIKRP